MNDIVKTGLALLVLAFFAEGTAEYFFAVPIKKWLPDAELRTWVMQVVAAIVGVLVAILYDFDVFEPLLGLTPVLHIFSVVATGIIVGRGSNYAHDFLKKLTEKPDNAVAATLTATVESK